MALQKVKEAPELQIRAVPNKFHSFYLSIISKWINDIPAFQYELRKVYHFMCVAMSAHGFLHFRNKVAKHHYGCARCNVTYG